MARRNSIAPQAVVFELALGVVGAVIALALDAPLRHRLVVTPDNLLRGAVACVPMLLLLTLLAGLSWRPIRELRRQVERIVASLFGDATLVGLAAVAASAGVGEEILFRGAVQPLISQWTTPAIGLGAASLLFGAAHAASATYFALAAAVGLYLGWLAQHYDDLVAPIVAHAGYDFIALLVLRRSGRDLVWQGAQRSDVGRPESKSK
ncbi:MAG: CPBP family intramembrane glutamic endopeptidase [Planctomycetota bacterium]